MFSWCIKRRQVDDEQYQPRVQTNTGKLTKKQLKDIKKQQEIWQKECLEAHNKYRAKHGVPPLVVSKKLNTFAAEWVNHLADNNLVQHRENNAYGENIAHSYGLPCTAEFCVKKWYDEIKNYNFSKPGIASNTGHFTQIVWKNTKKLGVAVAIRENSIWIVCNYDPPGNVTGQYLDCVPPSVEESISNLKRQLKPESNAENDPEPSKSVHSVRDTKNWSEFELDCLESHNKYRAMHGCPELKLNRMLCNYANEWSKRLAKLRSLKHRSDNKYGENLYYCMNFDPFAEECVKSFYNEIEFYDFSNPGFSSQTGHFTAVVWKDTTELGVGKTKIDNQTFVVCNYSPAGNIRNYYKEQVPPPLDGRKPTTSQNAKQSAEHDDDIQSFKQVKLDNRNNFLDAQDSPKMTVYKNVNFSSTSSSGFAQVRTTEISYTIRNTTTN